MVEIKTLMEIFITIGIFIHFFNTFPKFVISLKTKLYPIFKRKQISPLLIKDEVIRIIGISLLLNAIGFLISNKFLNILFLDMIGTAFCAYLLGPIWAAIVGLLSNSSINLMFYFYKDPTLFVFPWSIVNIAGGIFWGYMAKTIFFKNYLKSHPLSIVPHLKFLFLFGFLSSLFMNIPGAFIPDATHSWKDAMPNDELGQSIGKMIPAIGGKDFMNVLHYTYTWILLGLYSIPDKAICASLGIIILKAGFPIYERKLLSDSLSSKIPKKDNWFNSLLLFLLYIPSFAVFIFDKRYNYSSFSILWISPLIVSLFYFMYYFINNKVSKFEFKEKMNRKRIYEITINILQENPSYRFFQGMAQITIGIFLIFFIFILLLKQVFPSLVFNYVFVIWGVLFAVYTIQFSFAQNMQLSFPQVEKIQYDRSAQTFGKMENIGTNEFNLNLKQIKRGKTKVIYEHNKKIYLFFSDRVIAFDRELPTPIPNKGIICKKLSAFWFQKLNHIVNHFINDNISLNELNKNFNYQQRGITIQRLNMYPVECIVREYLVGSVWEQYSKNNKVLNLKLRSDLNKYSKFETPIFTPKYKDQEGTLTTITYNEFEDIVGRNEAQQIRSICFAIFKEASKFCETKGLILCDSKFEFGRQPASNLLMLADELLTPDSSRFFKIDDYKKYFNSQSIPSYDRQIIEDYLRELVWEANDPMPIIPYNLIQLTFNRYKEVYELLTDHTFKPYEL
ncbi:MAG: phosphoribosylaminoimidazolesuccinocarboxamide synthase [Bacteroidetes bacterium]|nr:phosphoribosylaminoimidazolesuccinocarboxamide synthase [Bacteroidota bacterium]